jgi:hypothetical protein
VELKLIRVYKSDTYTIGKLYINGNFFCDTLEDTVRVLNSKEDKIYGKTAIPSGIYEVKLYKSPKFGRYLPLLINVPFFTGILIHSGNTPEDTEGCILLGDNNEKGKVYNSKKYEKELVNLILDEKKIMIEIC